MPSDDAAASKRAPEAQLSALSDQTLIERCLAGSEGAWSLLVHRYHRLVYSVPHRMGLALELAEEVFQETFIALFEKLHTVRDRDRIGVWLAVTARRKALNRLTRGPSTHETSLSDSLDVASADDLPLDELMRLERQNEIQVALAALPQACRELLEALYFEDPAPRYTDLALRLGVPRGSLGPRRARCFEKLRAQLARQRRDQLSPDSE